MDKIDGDFFTVLGLPVIPLLQYLRTRLDDFVIDKNDYKLTGILGWPVSHSLPPYSQLLDKTIQQARLYIPLAIPPNNLKSAIDACYSLGMAGLNLTLPHKETCLSVLDRSTKQL